ncbi:hypothetical protein [Sorangium sp. So ce117]|uniref:hypothetical protein n=1 Tax=Sorangium sp. So ce117 TaxID=3133277 RepID=UPI003F638EDF
MTPLLSFEGFPPEAQAIKATLPQVAEFRAVHNIESLEQNAADPGPERARASRGEAPSLAGALYGEKSATALCREHVRGRPRKHQWQWS